MLILVDPLRVDPEERVWEPAFDGGVGEIGVDDQDGENGKQDAIAQAVEAAKGIDGPNDTAGIRVEECEVLLQNGLVSVLVCPVISSSPVW